MNHMTVVTCRHSFHYPWYFDSFKAGLSRREHGRRRILDLLLETDKRNKSSFFVVILWRQTRLALSSRVWSEKPDAQAREGAVTNLL